MTSPITEKRHPIRFFLLVIALSAPLQLAGFVFMLKLLPALPVSSLMAFCPLLAALILLRRRNKSGGVSKLLYRALE